MRVLIPLINPGIWKIEFSELNINTSATSFTLKDITSYCSSKVLTTNGRASDVKNVDFDSAPDGTSDHFVFCEFESLKFTRLA